MVDWFENIMSMNIILFLKNFLWITSKMLFLLEALSIAGKIFYNDVHFNHTFSTGEN